MRGNCKSNADLHGKVAVVTGGSAGMGYEAARSLAERGAKVIIASRNQTKATAAKNKIVNEIGEEGKDRVITRALDLASFSSIRSFVEETVNVDQRLDMLVNNVGAVALPDALTNDGLHMMMQVNYFGAFLLTYLLIPLLKSSAPSRIVNVSAATMYIGTIDFDNINKLGHWSSIQLLANSKLATALFTVELDKRLSGTGVTANSMDPFLIAETEILKDQPAIIQSIGGWALQWIGRPKKDAGEELAFLAMDPSLNNISGKHFKYCSEFFNTWLSSDANLRNALWDESKRLVNITQTEDWESIY